MEPKNSILNRTTGESERRILDSGEYTNRKNQLLSTNHDELASQRFIMKSSPMGHALAQKLLSADQILPPHERTTDFADAALRYMTSELMDTTFRPPRYEVLAEQFPVIPRAQVMAIKPKEAFFRRLKMRSQMVFRILSSFNKAVTYRTQTKPQPIDIDETLTLLPRYGDGQLQPWNLVIEQDDGGLEAYSLLSLGGTLAGKALIFKDWSSSLSQESFFLYHISSNTFYSYTNGESEPVAITPWDNTHTLIITLLGRCGGVFKARLRTYIKAVQAQLPRKRQVDTRTVTEEATKLYLTDFEKQQQSAWRLTTSPAIPKLGQYRGPLSKATDKKKLPHDRSEHMNRRYNADGTVRLEWKVAVTKVNGGVEARHGAQISDIIDHHST